ncbi:hypothetical protein SAMN05428988_4254 [Chitinophaga sp. YR573]|uniref:hypothetical protein n=1 Tax=Chitinophaga sp. YR573 TaxID=1881040 RepID=UPI0008D3DC85|nr:hypothetical protein [Chitinophaga sp. YR573]SEW34980.1 hypothetical protein SAMN05428988_4254 [Chitinophaga sp. YR573]
MNRNSTLIFLLVPVVFSSCARRSYYLSPFNGNATTYYAKPLLADSAKSATYFSATFTAGRPNNQYYTYDGDGYEKQLTDNLKAFQFSFHRSHTSKYFQAYYGASFTTGTYEVTRFDSLHYYGNYANADLSKILGGHKYFAGAGLVGGINLVMPFRRGHEWRVLGIETSIGKEWGDYLDFRKSMPDSSATAISKNDHYGYIGLTSELVFKKRQNAFGIKWALGTSLYRTIELGKSDLRTTYVVPLYFSTTFQYSRPKFTVFTQINATEHAESVQLGASYKLSKIHHR